MEIFKEVCRNKPNIVFGVSAVKVVFLNINIILLNIYK